MPKKNNEPQFTFWDEMWNEENNEENEKNTTEDSVEYPPMES